MSNIFSGNTDIDDIFEPIGDFAKRADVGIYNAAVDISNRFAPVSEGSPAAATGIYSGTTDIAQLFAAKGSVSYWDGVYTGDPYPLNRPTPVTGNWGELRIHPDGRISRLFFGSGEQDQYIGTYNGTLANSDNTEMRFVVSSSANASITNQLSDWTLISNVVRRIRTTPAAGQQGSLAGVLQMREAGKTAIADTANVTMSIRS